jgi:hypothetical protein
MTGIWRLEQVCWARVDVPDRRPRPFSVIEMESGKAHLLLTSTDILDGPHNIVVAVTTDQFRSQRPKLYAAVVAAFQQAIARVSCLASPAPKEASSPMPPRR